MFSSFSRVPTKPICSVQRGCITSIIDYWYESGYDRKSHPGLHMPRWFSFGTTAEQIAAWDAEIKDKFEKDYDKYLLNEYTGWPQDRDGRLAAILLLDQFPRSMFRKTAKSFDADASASIIAYETVKNDEVWKEYEVFEKRFFLVSLMHAENLEYSQL